MWICFQFIRFLLRTSPHNEFSMISLMWISTNRIYINVSYHAIVSENSLSSVCKIWDKKTNLNKIVSNCKPTLFWQILQMLFYHFGLEAIQKKTQDILITVSFHALHSSYRRIECAYLLIIRKLSPRKMSRTREGKSN